MTAAFIAALLLISAGYRVVSLYDRGAVWLYLYIAAVCLCFCAFAVLERRERKLTEDRIEQIFFDKTEPGKPAVSEDELSLLERRVLLYRRQEETREKRLSEGYANLASLVSDIAHQTKTPLSAIRLNAETLSPSHEAEQIRAQSVRLTFLIDALTRLSRCESRLIEDNLRPRRERLGELVCSAVSDVWSFAGTKSVKLECDVPDELEAYFDLRWTSEALFNLLHNSVKYSPPGGTVRIKASSYDMFARIDVSDDGPGVPEKEHSDIWKRFYRGENAVGDGVGIGLYLTREIVQRQGGRALLSDEGFSIFLPIQPISPQS